MRKFNKKIITTLVVASFVLVFVVLNSTQAVTPPDRGLGLADGYAVFGAAGVTNDGAPTHIWGDVGANSSVTGLDGSTQVDGAIKVAPATSGVATDASSTYDSLMSAEQGTPAGLVTDLDLAGTHTTLNNNPITPGVYNIQASTMDGDVELSGDGVYIFRSTSSVTSATSATHMTLTNGACASNVFWVIPASMTIGTGVHIEGTIIAQTGSITFGTSATLVGRAISLTQQVTLLSNIITKPTCAPSLILKKAVSVGSPDDPSVWTLTATGTLGDSDLSGITDTIGANSDLQFPDATFKADTYTLAEIPTTTTNYAATYSCENVNNGITTTTTSSSIVLVAGDKATCTITNTYTAPITTNLLTLVNTITKDNGGTALITNWTLEADGPTQISGITGADAVTNAVVNDGIYTLSETDGPTGYTASTYSCRKNGGSAVISNTINLANSDNAICTINNTDNAPTLTLQKVVVGGSDDATDWTLEATGPTGFTGLGPIVNNGTSFDIGTYDLSEVGPTGYDASDWVCVGGTKIDGNTVTLALDEDVTCTITNNYIAEEVTPSESHNSSGSTPTYGCKDEKATNYNYFSTSKTELCIYGTATKVITETPIVIEIPVIIPNLPHAGFPPQK